MKTVKDLREILKDLPDNMEVCGIGHYGERLECYYIHVKEVSTKIEDPTPIESLVIEIEDAGDEPD